jgi:peptidoglycan/xylan/chitin deacetylase (PgdA/CDA1 family)
VAVVLLALPLHGADRRIAFTFDDIPGINVPGCEAQRHLNEKLVSAIKRNKMPALGLVNGSRLCDNTILRIWTDAGLQLGSHTFSHPDFNHTKLADFEAEVIANEKFLHKPRYFRFPFLRTGTDLQKKRAIEEFLKKRGYTNAVVTMDDDDYIYAKVYADAMRRGDEAIAKRVAGDYIRYMDTIFAFYEQLSRDTLGYEIPQIVLLHDNSLNADHLDRLAAVARRRGYRFISVDDAFRDPAYARQENYIGGRGISQLHRWALEMGKKPAEQPDVPPWLMDLYRAAMRR